MAEFIPAPFSSEPVVDFEEEDPRNQLPAFDISHQKHLDINRIRYYNFHIIVYD